MNTLEFELFFDESYYGTWCVRAKQDKSFNSSLSFSFNTKEEAERFLEHINTILGTIK